MENKDAVLKRMGLRLAGLAREPRDERLEAEVTRLDTLIEGAVKHGRTKAELHYRVARYERLLAMSGGDHDWRTTEERRAIARLDEQYGRRALWQLVMRRLLGLRPVIDAVDALEV